MLSSIVYTENTYRFIIYNIQVFISYLNNFTTFGDAVLAPLFTCSCKFYETGTVFIKRIYSVLQTVDAFGTRRTWFQTLSLCDSFSVSLDYFSLSDWCWWIGETRRTLRAWVLNDNEINRGIQKCSKFIRSISEGLRPHTRVLKSLLCQLCIST